MRRDTFPPKTVLTPTEARQASPRRMNFRVLVVSLALLFVIGVALTAAFWGSAPQNDNPTPEASPPDQSEPTAPRP
jgi:hypothetical protein